MTAKQTDETKIAVIANSVGYMQKSLDTIEEKIDKMAEQFVTRREWEPYKKILQTLVGTILLAVLGAVLSVIFIKRS